MSFNNAMLTIICLILTFMVSSFLEYWLHRLMHIYPWFGDKVTSHYNHHHSNQASGVIWEFRKYLTAVLILSPSFLISPSVGIRVLLSGIVYAAFSAYAHQVQHDNPAKCFWMKMPVHYIHHEYNQWHHNFGIALDWWDYVFGTYKSVKWQTEEESRLERKPSYIRWW